MRILLIGKNSFIGKAFIGYCNATDKVDEFDIQNESLSNAHLENYEVVIHLAAIVHVTSKISKEKYFKINSDLAFEVARKCKESGVAQLLFFSSVKVFGESNDRTDPWNETSKCNPKTYYGQSKLDAEERISKLRSQDFAVSIIRPCLVYGPGVKANMYNLIKLIDKSPIVPFANIHNKRSFVCLQNLLALMQQVINIRYNGTVVAMDDRAVSTSDLANLIIANLKTNTLNISLPGFINSGLGKMNVNFFKALWGSFVVDPSNNYRQIDFKPPNNVEEGIKEMVLWYKNENA